MIAKTVFIVFMVVLTYVLILSNQFNIWAMLILAILHGFFTALIGLNIAHDAIHGAYSARPKVNKYLGLLFNLVGANDYLWNITHNIIHHTYPNVPDHDGDINQIPVLRMNPNQKLWGIHRFQHLYVFFLYALSSFSWVFIKDFVTISKTKIGSYDKRHTPVKEIIRLVGFKALYYMWFLIIPLIVINLPWYSILLGLFLVHLVEGITLSLVFQLSHVTEGASFLSPDENAEIKYSWADLQLITSANFGCKNPLVNFICGGLNFQIEHHLFPKVCHIHYPALAPIVRKTAEEFGLPYLEYPTFTEALGAHLRVLKQFGKNPDFVGVVR